MIWLPLAHIDNHQKSYFSKSRRTNSLIKCSLLKLKNQSKSTHFVQKTQFTFLFLWLSILFLSRWYQTFPLKMSNEPIQPNSLASSQCWVAFVIDSQHQHIFTCLICSFRSWLIPELQQLYERNSHLAHCLSTTQFEWFNIGVWTQKVFSSHASVESCNLEFEALNKFDLIFDRWRSWARFNQFHHRNILNA